MRLPELILVAVFAFIFLSWLVYKNKHNLTTIKLKKSKQERINFWMNMPSKQRKAYDYEENRKTAKRKKNLIREIRKEYAAISRLGKN